MQLQPLSIGVITSLGHDPLESLRQVRELGLSHAQVSYSPAWDSDEGRSQVRRARDESGVALTTLFCGFDGESYADIPTVRATVGLVPPATRAARLEVVEAISLCAQSLQIDRVGAHIGFVPEDASDPLHAPVVEVVRGVCERLGERGQVFALETGQESAAALGRFIGDVGAPNLRVNFDPANMIAYDNDDPIPATQMLLPWIDGVHCKDAVRPTQPGTLGHEVPLGQGQVDVARWLQVLLEGGYRGPLTIEREIHGEQQKRDIVLARELLESILRDIAPAS